MDGVLLATILAGCMLAAVGLSTAWHVQSSSFRTPSPWGSTAGIAVIIFSSQIKDLFGLRLAEQEPGELLEKLPVLWKHAGTFEPRALVLSLATIGVIVGLRKLKPHWPGMLIAVSAAAAATRVVAALRADDRLAVRRHPERLAVT